MISLLLRILRRSRVLPSCFKFVALRSFDGGVGEGHPALKGPSPC